MMGKPLDEGIRLRIADAVRRHGGNFASAARELGIHRQTVQRYAGPRTDPGPAPAPGPAPPDAPGAAQEPRWGRATAALRRRALSVEEVAGLAGATPDQARGWLAGQVATGATLIECKGLWRLAGTPPLGGLAHEYRSRPDHTFLFGVSSDQHLCSKYERLDVLNDLYDRFQAEGCDRVYNAGNWIEGEAPFNRYDVSVVGMDAQLRYLAERYPARPGITTYAIAGADHEGWYAKAAGVDIGHHAQQAFEDEGRTDWRYIGYMQANIRLVNHATGAATTLRVIHPGGGSAYALSYKPQKIVEHIPGGNKPGILVIGHYHKLDFNVIRNVFTIQSGCTKDQDPFAEQKGIDYHVGGAIVWAQQDPRTGAILRCRVEILRYFPTDYYEGALSHSGPVRLPDMALGGIPQ